MKNKMNFPKAPFGYRREEVDQYIHFLVEELEKERIEVKKDAGSARQKWAEAEEEKKLLQERLDEMEAENRELRQQVDDFEKKYAALMDMLLGNEGSISGYPHKE